MISLIKQFRAAAAARQDAREALFVVPIQFERSNDLDNPDHFNRSLRLWTHFHTAGLKGVSTPFARKCLDRLAITMIEKKLVWHGYENGRTDRRFEQKQRLRKSLASLLSTLKPTLA